MIEGQEGVTWEQWLALAHAAEAAGLDGLFRSDHYRSIVRGDPAGSLDAWATLAGLAARDASASGSGRWSRPSPSGRVVGAREDASSTVDHISGGRVELGHRRRLVRVRARGVRLPVPDRPRERLDELDRQLEEIDAPVDGRADDIWPKPVQQPRPPIIVGGTAKPRTVRAAVAHRRRVQHRLRRRSTRRASASASSTTPRARPAASRCASR